MLWSIDNLVLEQAFENRQKFNDNSEHDLGILLKSCLAQIDDAKRKITEIKTKAMNPYLDGLCDATLADYDRGEKELKDHLVAKKADIEQLVSIVRTLKVISS